MGMKNKFKNIIVGYLSVMLGIVAMTVGEAWLKH